ncbi:MAG: PfkB family carbohydrate kinase, partial [Nitrososphaeria archaeon]|nr:PfkB family carbohydrate kinase [Nitrososphaeria archaeon]
MRGFRVAVVGHLVIDEVVTPSGTYTSIGGVPTYAGLSIAALGHEPVAVTVVGSDGVWALEALSGLGVRTEGAVVEGDATTRFRIVYTGDSREMWLAARAPDVPAKLLGKGFDAVYFGPVAGEVGPELLEGAKAFKWSALDPQGLMRRFGGGGKLVSVEPVDLDQIRGIRVLRLAMEEARAFGYQGPTEAAVGLSRSTGSIVAVSVGREGVCVSDGELLVRGKAEVRPVDSTGAGDVFGGAFLVGLMETGDVLEATALGLSASAERVVRLGPGRLDGHAIRRRASEVRWALE